MPQFGHIGVVQVVKSPLVSGIGSLQVVEHQVTMAQESPGFTVLRIIVKCLFVELSSLEENVFGAVDVGEFDECLGIVGRVS